MLPKNSKNYIFHLKETITQRLMKFYIIVLLPRINDDPRSKIIIGAHKLLRFFPNSDCFLKIEEKIFPESAERFSKSGDETD